MNPDLEFGTRSSRSYEKSLSTTVNNDVDRLFQHSRETTKQIENQPF